VSDTQWTILCESFGWTDLASDERLGTNNARAQERGWLLPELRTRLGGFSKAELAERFESMGLPYAPITRPESLFEDPHLQASGGLARVTVPADGSCAGQAVDTQVPLLPMTLDGERLPLRNGPPALGADTRKVLASVGYSDADIDSLYAAGIVDGVGWTTPL